MEHSKAWPPFRVPKAAAGERLDLVLVARYEDLSRSRLQQWIRAGRVIVEGEPCLRPGTMVEEGMDVRIDAPTPVDAVEQAARAERLVVLFEDAQLVVLDKPAGLLVHPGAGGRQDTLAQLADARFGPLPGPEDTIRPGIVHRLDQDTSGVIVLARDEETLAALQSEFRERRVQKTYVALVHGDPRFDSDWLETPIGPDARRPGRFKVVAEGEGREAATFYETTERFGDFALLTVSPKTGRTHQIRVHLGSIGHPIVGDAHYRSKAARTRLPQAAPAMERQALHASRLAFAHPKTEEQLEFVSPLPTDMTRLLEWLRTRGPLNLESES